MTATTSVIVVAYRPHRWLADCLASVEHQADEVIVVDNCSPGDAVAVAARRVGAKHVRLSANTGFPAGVNAGIKASTGDLVALLNDDAFAGDGWLDAAALHLRDREVGIVSPKVMFAFPHAVIRYPDDAYHVAGEPRPLGRQLFTATVGGVDVLDRLVGPGIHKVDGGADGTRWRWTSGGGPIYLPIEPDEDLADLRVNGEAPPVTGTTELINNAGSYLSAHGFGGDYGYCAPDHPAFSSSAERFGACGAALVTRRDVIERAGPWASSFFAYYEDLDWSWRVRLAGFRIRYEPDSIVRHVGGVTTGGPTAPLVVGLARRNRLLCLVHNAPGGIAATEIRRALAAATGSERVAFGRAAPFALVARNRMARAWRDRRSDVWAHWAGRDETWPTEREEARP